MPTGLFLTSTVQDHYPSFSLSLSLFPPSLPPALPPHPTSSSSSSSPDAPPVSVSPSAPSLCTHPSLSLFLPFSHPHLVLCLAPGPSLSLWTMTYVPLSS